MKEIYLDNASTTRPLEKVIELIGQIALDSYGNPSSLHLKGFEAEKRIIEARQRIAVALDCLKEELVFTSGGTEGNNLAIIGAAMANQRRGKHLITTKVEHPSILETFKYLESIGFSVTYLDVCEKGEIDLNALREAMTPQTTLVSVMTVNNEIGTIFPIRLIVKAVKEINPNTLIHTDAVQGFLKIPFSLSKLEVDLATVSAHKIHGAKGTGALFIKKGVRINPITFGGGQEKGLRPGTENISGICGFGLAAEIGHAEFATNTGHINTLKNHVIGLLNETVPDFVINGDIRHNAPHILNLSFLGVRAETLVHSMAEVGIYLSTGSACHSKKKAGSHVIEALTKDAKRREGAVRISFSKTNTIEEMEQLVAVLSERLQILRSFKRR